MAAAENPTHHATTVCILGRAVMLRGAPGSGKSSLAAQLIDQPGNGLGPSLLPAVLLADDQTHVELRHGRLWAICPPVLAGRLEVRGQGIVSTVHVNEAPLALVVDLMPAAAIERLPPGDALQAVLMGVAVPRVCVDASHPSAATRVRVAFDRLAPEKVAT